MIGNARVVRLRPTITGTDRNHDPIYGAPDRRTLTGAGVAPRSSQDMRQGGRNGAITGLTVYAAPGADVLPGDGIEVDGIVYEIDGVPGTWRNPITGVRAGTEIPLRRADG